MTCYYVMDLFIKVQGIIPAKRAKIKMWENSSHEADIVKKEELETKLKVPHQDYEAILENETKGAVLHRNEQYYDTGDKSNWSIISLEKQRWPTKCIHKLIHISCIIIKVKTATHVLQKNQSTCTKCIQ